MKRKTRYAILGCIIVILCINLLSRGSDSFFVNDLNYTVVDAGADFNVKDINNPVKLNGKVEWITQLKVKIYIVRGYVLRLDFLDNPLWKANNFYHLRMSRDLTNWEWIVKNKQIDPSQPYIMYPETINEQLFFEVYVSNKEFNLL